MSFIVILLSGFFSRRFFYNCKQSNLLLNNYVYKLAYPSNAKVGELSYNATTKSVFQYCYYPTTCTTDPVYSNFTNIKDKSTIYTYDTDFTVTDTGETLLDALNAWVDKQQGEYNGLPLLHWEAGDEGVPAKLAGL